VIDSLIQFAIDSEIEVTTWDFKPPVRAIYIHLPDSKPVIAYCPKLENDTCLFRTVFSEELGHHFTSVGHALPKEYYNYADRLVISKAEYKAMRWGANFLMPISQLIYAAKEGNKEIWQIADYFTVTEEFVKFRLSLPDYQEFKTANRRLCSF